MLSVEEKEQILVETFSGQAMDLLRPDSELIHLDDIAHSLGNNCRFNGHTSSYYSVAEHSVLVACLVEKMTSSRHLVLAGFLHDAHEAYLGDIPTPIKQNLPGWKELSGLMDEAIGKRFTVDPELFQSPEVELADRMALSMEAGLLMKRRTRGLLPDDLIRPEDLPRRVIGESGFRWPTLAGPRRATLLFTEMARYLGATG